MSGFQLIENPESVRKLIERTIQRYGSDPELNYGYFMAHRTDSDKCVFIYNGKYGMQTTFDPKTRSWMMIGTPIAPKEEQANFLADALDYLHTKKRLRKFIAEFETQRKKQAYEILRKNYRVYAPSCVLYWPVYDMKQWNGHLLKGKGWKKVRNQINNITKNHDLKVIDSVDADKNELKDVVMRWVKFRNQTGFGVNRKDSNRTDYGHYLKLIDLDFAGCNFAKTVVVDGKASSITAGWEVPNKANSYYSGIGIYDLSIPNLGVYANWRDLVLLKKAGYEKVDFGGSPKPLLQFKKKFKPNSVYRTYIFSIRRKP